MIFRDITIIDENFRVREHCYVGIKGSRIDCISDSMPEEDYGRVIDGRGKLLMTAFYNGHAHSPMTLLRGYGENMSLQNWLFDRVFPFEDQLDSESVYYGTLLSMAESIKYGIVSNSDMYYFMDDIAKAYIESGMKGNISRSISHFDDSDFMSSYRAAEMIDCYNKYHGAEDGRLRVDMSLHSEYTTTESCARQLAEYTKKIGAGMQVHVSETRKEHEECKERHGMTPVQYLASCGIFDTPTTAAHCVWLEEDDFRILREKDVTVAVNTISNLKLASGVCNVPGLLEAGIRTVIGTDSVASNNSLNFFEEMKMFALLSKMKYERPEVITPEEVLRSATVNCAIAQGRKDCGLLKEGYRADLIMINTDTPNMHPVHDIMSNLVYSADSGDILMTVADGKILYENGEYKTVDIEKVCYNVEKLTGEILKKVGNSRNQ